MLAEATMPVMATVIERQAAGRFQVRDVDGGVQSAVVSAELADVAIVTGDRVFMVTPLAGFPGVIVKIERPLPAPSSSPFARRENHLSPEKLKIDRGARPDWPTGADRTPLVGEEVYCTEGLCSVVRVLGRTGNGSRLLELRLDGERKPFFAASSNVLVHPGTERERAEAPAVDGAVAVEPTEQPLP